jgi:hypothetical protein
MIIPTIFLPPVIIVTAFSAHLKRLQFQQKKQQKRHEQKVDLMKVWV